MHDTAIIVMATVRPERVLGARVFMETWSHCRRSVHGSFALGVCVLWHAARLVSGRRSLSFNVCVAMC